MRSRRREKTGEWVVGINSVLALLQSGNRRVYHILVSRERNDSNIDRIIEISDEKGFQVSNVDKIYITRETGVEKHQGIAVFAEPISHIDLDELIQIAVEDTIKPIIMLDGVEDPRNLGAIVRTAEFLGACGIIMRKVRQSPITSVAFRTAEGAFEYIPVSIVANLANALNQIKEGGVWAVSLEEDADMSLFDFDPPSPLLLIVGGEGKGVSRLLKDMCDVNIRIPASGKTSSLNASVALGITLNYINLKLNKK
jgi:23S rRNA (guanosine2251-2'-O)-methyltransferase